MIKLNNTEYYTTKEVSVKLGVHLRTVHSWIRDGKIKPFRFGPKKFYFDEVAIENCIKGISNE